MTCPRATAAIHATQVVLWAALGACFAPPPRPTAPDTPSDAASDGEVTAPVPCLVGTAPTCAAIAELALGRDHGCARTEDGRLFCWGGRTHAQVGDRVIAATPAAPTRVVLPAPIQAVAAGWDHTCALTVGGEVWCWGRNTEQQCGQPSSAPLGEPTRVALDPVAAIAAAGRSTCALMIDGQVVCWARASTAGRRTPTASSTSRSPCPRPWSACPAPAA